MASTISCASCSDDLSPSIHRMLRLAYLIAMSGGWASASMTSVSSPAAIRTWDLPLRRRHRPGPTNAGRCRFRHLRESRVGQRQPATAPLLPQVVLRRCLGGATPVDLLSSRQSYVHMQVRFLPAQVTELLTSRCRALGAREAGDEGHGTTRPIAMPSGAQHL